MFGLGLDELLLVAAVAAVTLAAPFLERVWRLDWGAPDPWRRLKDGAASSQLPYRAAKLPEVDPLIAQVAGLRRSLIVTRVAAVIAGLVVFGLGRLPAPTSSGAAFGLRPERARTTPSPPSTTPRAGLPFDPVQNPTATIGERFAYPFGLGGYQVPMRFDVPAQDPTAVGGPLVSATLELDLHLRVVPGQVQGTEGIWIDGVLSGTTWPAYRVPALISRDLSEQNVAFTEAVTRCCREQLGRVSLPLAALLEGSGRTVESVLADRRLDVDIADDVEVYGAGLALCRRAATPGGALRCVTVGARSLATEQ